MISIYDKKIYEQRHIQAMMTMIEWLWFGAKNVYILQACIINRYFGIRACAFCIRHQNDSGR